MTRNQKIGKFANAIRRFRGAYDVGKQRWHEAPVKHAEADVNRWARELGIDNEQTLERAKGFKTMADFEGWLRTL